MRKVLFVLLVLVMSVALNAQGSGIGVGLSTDGLAGKYWMGGSSALAFHLGNHIAVDYLLNQPDMLKLTDAPTPVYYGLGLRVGTGSNDTGEDELRVGVRGVLGIGYYIGSLPMDIYLEATPTLGVVGGGGFGVGGTFGFRYFF